MTTTTISAELTILDVGHGNCALVRDGPVVCVIDVPKRDAVLKLALVRLAEEHGITDIAAILVSHADEDHIGGVSALLCDEAVSIRRLYVNAEPVRTTDAWKAVRYGVRDALTRRPDFQCDGLTSMRSADLSAMLPELDIEVLAPGPVLALTGAGGVTPDGNRLSANSMSAVIRVSTKDTPGVILAGDIDRVGLDALLAEHPEAAAKVLVFPHHGGLPGRADPEAFAADLAAAVNPDVVVFSHGRQHAKSGQVPTPRPEIVAGLRKSCPGAQIACTQLSRACSQAPPGTNHGTLSSLRPPDGSGCAGTLEFRFSSAGLKCLQLDGHARWIAAHVPDRLCAFDET